MYACRDHKRYFERIQRPLYMPLCGLCMKCWSNLNTIFNPPQPVESVELSRAMFSAQCHHVQWVLTSLHSEFWSCRANIEDFEFHFIGHIVPP